MLSLSFLKAFYIYLKFNICTLTHVLLTPDLLRNNIILELGHDDRRLREWIETASGHLRPRMFSDLNNFIKKKDV